MARQEHVLSVFVASPSDVNDERARLEEVIRELNTTWSRELGLRLELIRWETHAYPGFGSDAQDVINSQIPDDYDIFIGIMWYRFGTPTSRASSGTYEEFNRAKSRYDADHKSVSLMFYFKDKAVSPSKLDTDQLAAVTNFRKSLGDEGGLYWMFEDNNEFEKLLRMHLTRCVQAWRSTSMNCESASRGYKPSQDMTESRSDLGLIELVDLFEGDFAEITDIATRIQQATEELGRKITQRSVEINLLKERTVGPVNRSAVKKVISKAAHDMDQYVQRMDAEIPLFATRLDSGMNALIQVVAVYAEMQTIDEGDEDVQNFLEEMTRLHDTLLQIETPLTQFQSVVSILPQMTSELNRSKRRVVNVLQQFIDQLHKAQKLSHEAKSVVKDLLSAQLKTP
jgi:hypothetical protein